jgi:hypothetical protein
MRRYGRGYPGEIERRRIGRWCSGDAQGMVWGEDREDCGSLRCT